MDNIPKGWRLGLLIALWIFFPIVFHPWWLLVLSLAAYSLLICLLLPRKSEAEMIRRQDELMENTKDDPNEMARWVP